MEQWRRKTIIESLYFPLIPLFVAAFAIFSNTFANSWTYDDFSVIVNNPDIRSLWDFKKDLRGERPLRELSLLIDYQFFGFNPVGYHFQNIFWHALNSYLIFILAFRLGGTKFVAWGASFLFLVHPAQVEVVANISNRKDSIALAFILLSFLAYVESMKPYGKRNIWLLFTLILSFMAYQAKQNALALPLVFIGYELVYFPQKDRLLLRRIWPWLLLLSTAVMAFFAWYFFFGGRDIFLQESHERLWRMNYFFHNSETVYFMTVFKSWVFMFQKFVLPYNLAPDYIFDIPRVWSDPYVLLALAALISYGVLLAFTFKRSNLLFFALIWLGAFWLPTSNLFPLPQLIYFAADRFLYAPSVGFFFLVLLIIEKFLNSAKIRIVIIIIVAIILSSLTWKQNAVWQSSSSLWDHTIKISPQSIHALNNIGIQYMRSGDYEQASAFFLKATNVNPYHAISHYHLGVVYEKVGKTQKALEHYKKFFELAVSRPRLRFRVMVLKHRLENEYGVIF